MKGPIATRLKPRIPRPRPGRRPAMKVPGKALWEPMTEDEIETAITEFVMRRVAAKKSLGFDCVEFHGAHSAI